MSRMRRVFRLPVGPARVRREVDEELRFHIDERIEELVAAGRSREDAEREVHARFGNRARVEAQCEAIDRASWRRRERAMSLEALAQDARVAVRGLVRRPAYTAVVGLTLALAIGANAAIFGAVHSVLLRPVDLRALDRVVIVRQEAPALKLSKMALSPQQWMAIDTRHDLFEATTAYTPEAFTLTGFGEPVRIEGSLTLGRFFDVFEATPEVGRLYRHEASENGEHRTVVIADALWRRLSDGDPSFVGRSIELNGTRYQVTGVLAPGEGFPRESEIWAPFPVTPRILSPQHRESWYMDVAARMRPEITRERLAARLEGEMQKWLEVAGGAEEPLQTRRTYSVFSLATFLAGPLRLALLVLMGAVGLVLLIACANVASLQLVRGASRARELAVRTALGAGRWAIARQLLVESLLLAVVGGLVGVGLGALAIRVLARTPVEGYDMLAAARLHPATLAFAAGLTILAAVMFGLVPALRASRVDVQDALKASGRTSTGSVSRHGLLRGSVIVQMALTLVLLLGSGLMIRSLSRLIDTSPGFRPERVMSFRLTLPEARYPTPASRLALFQAMLERARAVPGIEAIGLTTNLPFDRRTNSTIFDIADLPRQATEPERHANLRFVDGGFFRTLGIPLLEGRTFDARDAAGAPGAVIVDAELVREHFGDRDPIGATIDMGGTATIVGVVGSVKHGELGEPLKPTIYLAHPQYGWVQGMQVAVRSAMPLAELERTMRSIVRSLDATLPIAEVTTVPDLIHRSLGTRRIAMTVLSGFAALSLLLALLGVYGVLSYATAERTREIGIRMALGAEPRHVVRMVLRSGVLLAVLGLAIGAALFLVAGRVMRGLLYGVGPDDPVTLVAAAGVLTVAAVVACWIPARRAARLSPVVALKNE